MIIAKQLYDVELGSRIIYVSCFAQTIMAALVSSVP